jgi:hypothetical protein
LTSGSIALSWEKNNNYIVLRQYKSDGMIETKFPNGCYQRGERKKQTSEVLKTSEVLYRSGCGVGGELWDEKLQGAQGFIAHRFQNRIAWADKACPVYLACPQVFLPPDILRK